MAYILAKKQPPSTNTGIYGAKWLGTSDPAWIRTDDAANFPDPNPYYAGMSDTPSSPFDNISPWKDLARVEDSDAGTLVKIPKYYYKWTRTGDEMLLQISATRQTGFLVSPAHADRGDGKGERSWVYVGAYHCAASTYKSTTGVKPQASQTRATFRSSIHNLGSNFWQWDFAMYWTIAMLYLVEYAHWNSQLKIGYGCGNNSGTENAGLCNTMIYHTGTNAASRTTYGHTRYRYIEDLWGNVFDWCDGIYFGREKVYCIKNPANFSDTGNGTLIGSRAQASGYISAWAIPSVTGFEYALFPSEDNGSESTYVCDVHNFLNSDNLVVLCVGSNFGQGQNKGLFFLSGYNLASHTTPNAGSRLMKLP